VSGGSPSPFQPEPEGADRAFYERQALIAAAVARRRGQDN
jgi:hypothetical protein